MHLESALLGLPHKFHDATCRTSDGASVATVQIRTVGLQDRFEVRHYPSRHTERSVQSHDYHVIEKPYASGLPKSGTRLCPGLVAALGRSRIGLPPDVRRVLSFRVASSSRCKSCGDNALRDASFGFACVICSYQKQCKRRHSHVAEKTSLYNNERVWTTGT